MRGQPQLVALDRLIDISTIPRVDTKSLILAGRVLAFTLYPWLRLLLGLRVTKDVEGSVISVAKCISLVALAFIPGVLGK